MKAEEMITRGQGNYLHCTDYEDAVKAIYKYAEQKQNDIDELVEYIAKINYQVNIVEYKESEYLIKKHTKI